MELRRLSGKEDELMEEAVVDSETYEDHGFLHTSLKFEPTGNLIELNDLKLVEHKRFDQNVPWGNPENDAIFYGKEIGANYVLLENGGSFLNGYSCDARYFNQNS